MTTPGFPATDKLQNLKAGIVRRFGQVLITFALQAFLLFACSGHLDWSWAWLYLAVSIMSVLINGTILFRKSPETISERGQAKETRTWDKIVSTLYAVSAFLALPMVAGLDVRYGWTGDMIIALHIAGAVLVAIGYGLGGWAMIVNAFFSTAVRIQTERGHTVCQVGPYRFVRHPGYAGFILQTVATSLLLGSLWGMIPALAAALSLVVRTGFEDRALQEELAGYSKYVSEVHYRLVPGIW